MMARDNFSNFLLEKLKKCNVKTDYVSFTDKAGTGLAFVSLDKNGDRSFSFFRNPCADMLFDKDEVREEYFEKGDVLHFCSVDLVDCPTKEATKKAIDIASKKGCYVSFDKSNIFSTPFCRSFSFVIKDNSSSVRKARSPSVSMKNAKYNPLRRHNRRTRN